MSLYIWSSTTNYILLYTNKTKAPHCYAQPFTNSHSFYPNVFYYCNLYKKKIWTEGERREMYNDIKNITCQNNGIERRNVCRIFQKYFKKLFVWE
jgi:hypothetical protein